MTTQRLTVARKNIERKKVARIKWRRKSKVKGQPKDWQWENVKQTKQTKKQFQIWIVRTQKFCTLFVPNLLEVYLFSAKIRPT